MGWRDMAMVGLAAGVLVAAWPAAPVAGAPQDGHYWIEQLGLQQAWQAASGAGVTVGVLDTGVNADHPDLAGAVLAGRAFPDLGDGTRDGQGHGTTVAMLIADRGRHGATMGVAPQARIRPAVAAGGKATVDEALRWLVDQRVSVVNLSLGRGASSTAYDRALRYAADHDVVVVAAAGNAGQDPGVVSPADRPGVLAVSAVDRDGAFRPEVSVSGPAVALAAPGVDIVTAAESPAAGRSLSVSGTSYAAAIVTGVVALVRSRFPRLDAANVVQRVVATARRGAGTGRDPLYGFGIVDPVAALTATVPTTTANPLGTLPPVPGGTAGRPGQHRKRTGSGLLAAQPSVLLGMVLAVAAGLGVTWAILPGLGGRQPVLRRRPKGTRHPSRRYRPKGTFRPKGKLGSGRNGYR